MLLFPKQNKIIIKFKVESFTQSFSAIEFDTAYIGNTCLSTLKIRLIALKNRHKILFSEYSRNITVTCIIEFCIMAS